MNIPKRVVIGFGTGRCGSKSLAEFLNQQDLVNCNHEGMIPFDPQWDGYMSALDLLLRRDAPIVGNISAAWVNYVDRLIMDVPDLRLILLDRADREHVVKSFDSYLSKQLKGQADLRSVYPIFRKRYSTAAIHDAVDRYIYKTVVLTKVFKDQILVVKTLRLSEEITQKRILQFIGIPQEDWVLGMPWENKNKDMSRKSALKSGISDVMGKRVDLK
ncbi:MAG: hypothetical protein ACXAEN_21390 [Candidatus Thorarchaeota archaeon]|jgi:hypothetical protein